MKWRRVDHELPTETDFTGRPVTVLIHAASVRRHGLAQYDADGHRPGWVFLSDDDSRRFSDGARITHRARLTHPRAGGVE